MIGNTCILQSLFQTLPFLLKFTVMATVKISDVNNFTEIKYISKTLFKPIM